MTHVFKHPKYYTELRKRNKALRLCDAYSKENSNYTERQQSDQAISDEASTEATSVRPDPGLKQQATSVKRQAVPDAGDKRQAPSTKGQAPSHKRQAP